MLAALTAFAGVHGTGIVVLAGVFIQAPIAVVIQTVTGFFHGLRGIAGGQA
jgi:hypothetical protein